MNDDVPGLPGGVAVTVRRYPGPACDRKLMMAEVRLAPERGAGPLLRSVGLMPDGPVLWGRPLTSRASGVYIVELAEPVARAPIEMDRIGRWIERLPDLKVDGARPTGRVLLARLGSLWLPSETILYAGATTGSVGGRVLAMAHHALGDRRPHPDGQWLHTLVGMQRTRVWWAETDATEEYLDAIFEKFAEEAAQRAGLPGGLIDGRPRGAILMPWANTRRQTGERQVHGITGAYVPDDREPAIPTHVVELPAGDADGAKVEDRGTGTARRGLRPGGSSPPAVTKPLRERPSAARRATPSTPSTPARRDAAARAARIEAVPMTAEALVRLETELHELTQVRRPGVVARIKAAREHGDLKENAEYQAAREEQSFMEGRVRLLEERKRHAVVVEETVTGRVGLGSIVVVESDGETFTYSIVGTTDADPSAGRISTSSPVGAALVGAVAGADVEVRTPRGAAKYRVVEVR